MVLPPHTSFAMNPALAYEAMARNSCFCVAMRIVAPTMIMTGTKAKMSSVSAQLRMKPMMRPMTKAALARGVDPRVRREELPRRLCTPPRPCRPHS